MKICDERHSCVLSRMVAVLLLAALATGCDDDPPRATTARDEAILVEMQQVLAKAWVDGDRGTIERMIAPDWNGTGPDGRTIDRAEVLTQVFEKRVHKIHRLEIDAVQARAFGEAAVVTGRTRGAGEFDGVPYDVVIRFTDTFVRRDGRWQAVASHASLVSSSK
jgi:hypothetical protein